MNAWILAGCFFGGIYLVVFLFSYIKIYKDLWKREAALWKKIIYPFIFALVYILAVVLFTPMLIVIFPFAFLQGLLSSINKKN